MNSYKPFKVAPAAGSVPPLIEPAAPWGRDTICPGCNRGATYSCICDPFFEDEDSPEPRFDPDNGWGLAERAAYGMGVKL